MKANSLFSEATTSVAFCINLSKRQCHALLMESMEPTLELTKERLWVLGVDSLAPLHRKGLVFWHRDADGRPNGYGGLTEAGRLMAALLREAGLTLENTRTASTIARRARLEEAA